MSPDGIDRDLRRCTASPTSTGPSSSSRSRDGSTPDWAPPRPSPPCWARAPTAPLVTFNGEHFFDQRARRPVAHIVNGVTTELTWPHTVVRHGQDAAGADVLYLVGPEPDFHWRAFTDAVVGLAKSWRVRMVVGLGAFPAPAPHTRPVKLAATAPPASADLVERIGIVQGELEVPAGVHVRARAGVRRRRHPRRHACGPGCRTTWPACPSPRPARR